MTHLYKASIWQSKGSGRWYCGDTEDLGNGSGRWWIPARVLGITPAEFAKLLINEFGVSTISYSKEHNFLFYAWDSEAKCRKYKNWINKKAREAQYLF